MNISNPELQPENLKSEKGVTTVVYALQAASFLFLITLLIGVIINYVKRDDVKGSWLESHFRWQIRTFWFSLLWAIVGFITAVIAGWLRHPLHQRRMVCLSHHQGLAEALR